MVKACRTCEQGVLVWGCQHSRPTEWLGCQSYEPRETPLLVDELVKAAKELMLSISMDMVNIARYDDCKWTAAEFKAVVEAWEGARQALARYEKEVGNAQEAE